MHTQTPLNENNTHPSPQTS